jgi:hypothetical protein
VGPEHQDVGFSAAASSSSRAAWPPRRTPETSSPDDSFRASSTAWSSSSWPWCLAWRPCSSRGPPRCCSTWTSCKGSPRTSASRIARARVPGLRGESSTPTTTGRPGLRGRRMTMSGHGAVPAKSRQTEPATWPSTAPSPRLPTTSRRADPAASRSTGAGSPASMTPSTAGTPGAASPAAACRTSASREAASDAVAGAPPAASRSVLRASSRPSARMASAECRSPLPATPLTGPRFLVKTGHTHAWTTRRLSPAANA